MIQTLTSVTRNLPPLIKNPATSLLGKHCYTVLVENLDILEPECLKLGISRALGLGIVIAGAIVKVPQLLKLVNAQSSEGLSVTGYVLETVGYIITLAYNVRSRFPFSTYGETAFISVQNVLILMLILHYSDKDTIALGALGAVLAGAYPLFDAKLVGHQYLQILQGLSIPLSVTSKLPQILANYQNQSTGQLSAFTVFNYLAGSAVRVFTTVTEVNDPFIFWGFVIAAALNAVLAIQMVYYWKPAPEKPAGAKPQLIKPPTTPRRQRKTPRTSAPTTPTTPTGSETSKASERPKTPRSPGTPSRKGRSKKKS